MSMRLLMFLALLACQSSFRIPLTRLRSGSFKRIRTSASQDTVANTAVEQLRLFNSATRSKLLFKPLQAGRVKMYTCGPTLYDHVHIGNLRAFLAYDLLKRVLLFLGFEVEHVCNLTDIDDKIIDKVMGTPNQHRYSVTNIFEQSFFADLQVSVAHMIPFIDSYI